jgi:hypothetical protein
MTQLHKTFFSIVAIQCLFLFMPPQSLTGEAKRSKTGVIEGTVTESISGQNITLVTKELIPKTEVPLRYVFRIKAMPSKTIILGEEVEKVGARIRVEYENLSMSEMDHYYTGDATRITKILGPEVLSNPLLVRMKQVADQEAVKLGYDINNMGVELDVANSQWKKYSAMQRGLPENISKISGKDFIAVYYFPIPSPDKVMLGGDLWVFLNRGSGEVITVLRGK